MSRTRQDIYLIIQFISIFFIIYVMSENFTESVSDSYDGNYTKSHSKRQFFRKASSLQRSDSPVDSKMECQDQWDLLVDRCIFISTTAGPWGSAFINCERKLKASMFTGEEPWLFSGLRQILAQKEQIPTGGEKQFYWIGLRRKEDGEFRWNDKASLRTELLEDDDVSSLDQCVLFSETPVRQYNLKVAHCKNSRHKWICQKLLDEPKVVEVIEKPKLSSSTITMFIPPVTVTVTAAPTTITATKTLRETKTHTKYLSTTEYSTLTISPPMYDETEVMAPEIPVTPVSPLLIKPTPVIKTHSQNLYYPLVIYEWTTLYTTDTLVQTFDSAIRTIYQTTMTTITNRLNVPVGATLPPKTADLHLVSGIQFSETSWLNLDRTYSSTKYEPFLQGTVTRQLDKVKQIFTQTIG